MPTLIRILASTILGLIIFVAILGFLLTNSLNDDFLSADFYKKHFSENGVYDRFYDAVLIPRLQEQIDDRTRADFLGGLLIDREDVADLVRGILPVSYLRGQVEGAIDGTADYLNKEKDPDSGEVIQIPEVFIELRPIIGTPVPPPPGVFPVEGTAKSVIFDFLGEQIEENIRFVSVPRSTISVSLERILDQFRDPTFPIEVPSFESLTISERIQVYDEAKALLFAQDIPQEVRNGLEEVDSEIKTKLRGADPNQAVIEALQVAIRPLVEPVIDDAFNDFRKELELDSRDRFDPVLRLGTNRDETKQDVLDGADNVRDWLNTGKTFGTWIALLIISLGSITLGAVHLPRLRSVLGWPGLTLLLSGGFFLGLAIILKSQLPDRLESFLESRDGGCSGIVDIESSFSPELCEIAVDVTRSMASDISGGFILPSALILIIGIALLVASYLAKKVTPAT